MPAGAEVSELAIHPTALGHILDPEAALLECHVANTPSLDLTQI
jgi:hypothetical protein